MKQRFENSARKMLKEYNFAGAGIGDKLRARKKLVKCTDKMVPEGRFSASQISSKVSKCLVSFMCFLKQKKKRSHDAYVYFYAHVFETRKISSLF